MVILSCALSAALILSVMLPDAFLFFGDAVSHLVRSRQFIDSQLTGFSNIGTVWLPLPHLMLIPFVAVDPLFYSGTAGAFLNIPLLVLTSLLLYRTIELLTRSVRTAFFFVLLFGTNLNILYMALTPMNEIPFLFFLAGGMYALLRFIRTGSIRWSIVSSAAVLSATLCRYEAWILAPFLSLIFLNDAFRSSADGGGRKRPFGRALVTAILPWIGIFFWFGWNHFQYGDPLKFAHWTFDVGTPAVRDSLQESPQELFRILGMAVVWIFGPVLSAAGLLMLFSFRRLSTHPEHVLILLYTALPMCFTAAAIQFGFVQIDQWWWNWRFVLPFGLFLTISGALAFTELQHRFPSPVLFRSIVILFALVPLSQMLIPSVGVALFKDASKSYDERSASAAAVGAALRSSTDADSVSLLTGYGVGQRIMVASGLPLRSYHVHYFPEIQHIPISGRYVVIGMDARPESKEFSDFWNTHRQELSGSYLVLHQDRYFLLLKHR